jgi:hypothetical protein
MLDQEFGPQWVKAHHVQRLQEMGFLEKAVRQALAAAGDRLEPALEQLQVRVCVFAGQVVSACVEGYWGACLLYMYSWQLACWQLNLQQVSP